MIFEADHYYGFLVQGNYQRALSYLDVCPGEERRKSKLLSLFNSNAAICSADQEEINEILHHYWDYYRDVFYLQSDPQKAENQLQLRLCAFFREKDTVSLCAIEQELLPAFFEQYGYHFLGGKTGGFYGPYIWKTTETRKYQVELPENIQPYFVQFHSGFLHKSWLDFLSLGEISTGGWTDGDSLIHCIADCYDDGSEDFQVSLLKHEAQHVMDLARWPDMPKAQLEYRAKLVELIYSRERNLLPGFCAQAGTENAHALAAGRIASEFAEITGPEKIRTHARLMFMHSSPKIP